MPRADLDKDPGDVAAIREAFDSRLTPWTPGSAHWLCLVVRDVLSQAPLGVTGYIHGRQNSRFRMQFKSL